MALSRTVFLAVNFCLFSMMYNPAIAEPNNTATPIHVSNAYVNAPPPVMKMTAGFFEIHNDTEEKITLINVSSPIAAKVEIHQTTETNGMMTMRRLDALDIPPHSQVSLAPGGKHLMLSGLNQRLEPGQSLTLTLDFSDQKSLTIKAKIRDIRNAHHHEH